MIKKTCEKFAETYYLDQCNNGLKIVVWHKPEFTTTSAIFATPYGSNDYCQLVDQEKFEVPLGVAHFLEHKLFESDKGDVMGQFSALGCNVNAFTSYDETVYYFTTSNKDITKPLNLLLDFVQDLDITDESVEKEKGIINQELQMYLEMPDSRMFVETFKGLFLHHPIRNDIGGTFTTVNSTTKEILQKCYAINYHPSQMMVVVTTAIDPEIVINLIKENQAKKQFPKSSKVKRFLEPEPIEVAKRYQQIEMDIENPKTCLGFKFKTNNLTKKEAIIHDWAFKLLFEAYFTSINADYQKWLDQGEISHYFGYASEFNDEFGIVLFFDETDNQEKFEEFIKQHLNKVCNELLDDKLLQQLRNRYFGETMLTFNKVSEISIQYFRDYMSGVQFDESLEIINNMNPKMIQDIVNKYNFENISSTSLICKK